jgi:LPXTG-motif cell wall-anchored protein
MVSGKLLFIGGLLALLFIGFSALAFAQGNVLTDPPKNYELVQGWYQGRQTFYYEFGMNTSLTSDGQSVQPAPIYVLVTGFDADGNPQPVEGQHNIVDVIPGDEGYSDLWQVMFVTVPADYQANTITAAADVLSGGYEITEAGVFVNCPIVPAGSTLAEGGDLVQGWYKGQEVYYFDFGPNTDKPAPIYAFVTGFDSDDNPQFVEGQNNVIDVIPGDEGYSAFWNVNLVVVPADYQANTITSADEVLAAGYDIMPTALLVNCPVVRTAEAMAGGESETPAQLPTTGGVNTNWMLWLALIGVGSVLTGLGAIIYARFMPHATK